MRKKLVNQKRDELKTLPREDLINRICDYHNQELLNRDEDGNRREYPIGEMAGRIRDNAYRMSDNQYYTLIHHFTKLTVPEMKVVGITYYNNNPAEFEKNLISEDRRKSTYEMDYTLRPEPTNEHDPNAVMVLVNQKDGELHQIGYLNAEFVAEHRITEEMRVDGYLTDWSHGKFKVVSYSLALDTEELDNKRGLNPQDQNGASKNYVYECSFQCNGTVPNPDAASAYIEQTYHMSERMNNEFSSYHLEAVAERLTYAFEPTGNGVVRLETNRELEGFQKTVADSFMNYLHEPLGPIASCLKNEGFVNVAPHVDTFDASHGTGFELKESPNEGVSVHMYQAEFSLTNPVSDLSAARSYLTEDDMTGILKDDILSTFEDGESANAARFEEAVIDIQWNLETLDHGNITLLTARKLNEAESSFLSEWIEGQNADGLGEGFEQQPFAQCIIEEAYEEDGYYDDETGEWVDGDWCEEEYDMCSFDWETNKYLLVDVTKEHPNYIETRMNEIRSAADAPLNGDDFKDAVDRLSESGKTSLTLTEADLAFETQTESSDYGIV